MKCYSLHVFSDTPARRCQAQPLSKAADWEMQLPGFASGKFIHVLGTTQNIVYLLI